MRIPLCRPVISSDDRAAVQAAMEAGWVSSAGPQLLEFERHLGEYTGVADVVVVSSGTAALHLALTVSGIKPGDEVFVSDFNFAASAFAASYCNAELSFVDCSTDDWNADPSLVRDELVSRRLAGLPLPKALLLADIYGSLIARDRYLELRDEFGLVIIEDAAEALGSTWPDGSAAGTAGDLGCLSFNGNKLITAGAGGAVLCKNRDQAQAVRHLANQSKIAGIGYDHDAVGYNYRMTAVHAALGNSQLNRIDRVLSAKRRIADTYREQLSGLGIKGIPNAEHGTLNEWMSVVLLPRQNGVTADELVVGLAERGIEARPAWSPLSLMDPFASCGQLGHGNAKHLRNYAVALPCSEDLTIAEQHEVIEEVAKIVGSGPAGRMRG